MPTFSVLIPAYQAADTVGRAVRSALDQTLPPRDVIVCDDGSTDDLAGALAPFPGVTLVRQTNQGVSAATNRAASEARGEVLVKLDADDAWRPGRLAAIGALFDRRPEIDIVTTDATVVELDGSTWRYYEGRPPFPPPEAQRLAILRGNFIFGSAAVRRAAFDRIDGFRVDVRHQGEYEGWIRMVMAGSRAGLIPEPLAFYYRRPSSLSARSWERASTIHETLSRIEATQHLSAAEQRAIRGHKVRLSVSPRGGRLRTALLDVLTWSEGPDGSRGAPRPLAPRR
ncbi:glycosyltransferase family 2 protein [Rubrivirga sp. IMCC43871]|uniref:glycosyltransferase family 2 protein n=1 Tax=Rubrivirga sp. IMCC43871 TaxID=3391575 RepID=UPI0039901C2B